MGNSSEFKQILFLHFVKTLCQGRQGVFVCENNSLMNYITTLLTNKSNSKIYNIKSFITNTDFYLRKLLKQDALIEMIRQI